MTSKKFDKEEKDFQDTYDIWVNNEDPVIKKKAWDHMWILVNNACDACCKSKAYGIHIPDLEAKSLDACCKVMIKIQNGVRPEKISSYVYLWCIGELYSAKHRRWEQSESFDGLFDNYATVTDENGFISLCSTNYS